MSRTKKKILITTSTFPRYDRDVSSARFVMDLAVELVPYYDVHVVAPHSPGALCYEEKDGLKIHRFRYFFPENLEILTREAGIMANIKGNKAGFVQLPFFFISEILSIARLVRREKIDIVNSHWMLPQGLAGSLLRNILNVKHVLTIHAAGIFALKRWGKAGRKISQYIISRSDLVLPVSGYIKGTLDGLVDDEYLSATIPMGVPVRRFRGRVKEAAENKKELKLLFVGKLVEKKGLKYLLEAVKMLKEKDRAVRLVVAGSGPLEEELKRYVSLNGIDKYVDFLGWTPNGSLPELYSESDITVVPSIYDKKGETEGMPVVVLESMAMGTPVLGSRISGLPDIIQDGVNGWLVPPGSGEAITEAIDGIFGRDLIPISTAALSTAYKYTCEEIAVKYRDTIEGLYK